jgi:citrate lyase subunit beta/citryl-CoA lyase
VNQIGSRWCHRDVLEVVAAAVGPVTLVVPEVDSPDDVAFVDRLVRGRTRNVPGPGVPSPRCATTP